MPDGRSEEWKACPLLSAGNMPRAAVIPVNYRTPDASPATIAREVDYVMQVAHGYVSWIAGATGQPPALSVVQGLDILELGPGPSLGPAVVLACGGARVVVSDRFATRWHDPYHRAVFQALIPRVEAWRPGSTEPMVRLLQTGSFVPEVVQVRECAAEDLTRLPGGSADIVLSNAVLEHLADVPRALSGLAHVTRPGGLGLHQVDFRDHRDFTRPLEYLTMAAREFKALFAERMGECGNRWRPSRVTEVFEAAGFHVRSAHGNMQADPEYVAGIKVRLHPDVLPMSEPDLSTLSVFYVVERRAQA
ncbi:MAG: methyltransferase domain-containing protein [Vicinamibacterales bacterium]